MCSRCDTDDVIDALYSRKGFDEWWDDIEFATQEEIREEIRRIIGDY